MNIRPPLEDEWAFVFAGWIRSQREFAPCRVWHDRDGKQLRGPYMGRRAWDGALKCRIERLRRDAAVSFVVAEFESALLGFLCGNREAVHYVYVEPKFRHHGIGRALVAHVYGQIDRPHVYTHWTPAAEYALFREMTWDETSLEDR